MRHPFRDSERGSRKPLIVRWRVELGKCVIEEHTKTHQDLEWFRPPKHNTLYPFFCITPVRSWNIELGEAGECELPEKGLSSSRVS
jgi:hypothetical protein